MLNPRDVQTVEQARQIVEERKLAHVKVGLFDNDGVMLGKYMSREKFFASLDHGFSFCDVILGWDVKDQLYDNSRYTGWHTGYPDASVRILADSCREIHTEPGMLLFMGNLLVRLRLSVPAELCVELLNSAKVSVMNPLQRWNMSFFCLMRHQNLFGKKALKTLSL